MKSTSDTYIPEEIMSFSDLKLFALSSNKELAERVAQEIGIELGKSSVRQFFRWRDSGQHRRINPWETRLYPTIN